MRRTGYLSGVVGLAAGMTFALPDRDDWADFGRYQIILDRAPFGAAPVASGGLGAGNGPEVDIEPVPEGPDLQETLKLSMLTRYGGTPAAGFTDSESGRSFYLFEGQSIEEYTLVAVDVDRGVALLRKGSREAELALPGVTSPSESAAATPSGPAAVRAALATHAAGGTASDAVSYRELQRQRYEEARRRREEETERLIEQATQRSDAERLQHLRQIELERIRQGGMPLIPITLTPQEAEELAREGFDVSGEETEGPADQE